MLPTPKETGLETRSLYDRDTRVRLPLNVVRPSVGVPIPAPFAPFGRALRNLRESKELGSFVITP